VRIEVCVARHVDAAEVSFMPIYLTLYEGETAAHAQPVIATSDPAIIALVRRLLLQRLSGDPLSQRIPRPRREPPNGQEPHDASA
jgi:hypothetical protein